MTLIRCLISLTIITIFTSFIFKLPAWAGSFQLTAIGSLQTNGATFDHWWYTSSQPTFTGTALANASVTADIDGTQSTVTADSNGNWSFTPSALSEGDHSVSFTSNGSTIAFTLTIGTDIPANVSAPTAPETPVVGFLGPTIAFFSLGGLITAGGYALKTWRT